MDIAYYISDLLGQQGELSVPNLGYFVQIRMNAYYDEKAKKFFPPHYAVKFDPQVIDDDDTLASYITNLKKISLASAKYFIEKYISNLKSQVIIEDVPFATLGAFSSDGVKLSFQAGTKTDDPSFFGFTEIDAFKIGETPVAKPAAPVEKPVIAAPAPVVEQPVNTFFTSPVAPVQETPAYTPPPAQEYTYDDEPAARSMSIWIILLIAVTLMAIAFVAIYKFKPEWVKEIMPTKKYDTTEAAVAVPIHAKKPDTIVAKPPVQTDTTTTKKDTAKPVTSTPVTTQQPVTTATTPVQKTPIPANTATQQKPAVTTPAVPAATNAPVNLATEDTVAKGSWVIYNGAFPTKSGAEARIDYDKGKGFAQARLLKKKVGPGGNYKVILGAYKTKAEATSASQDLMTTGKIKKTDLSIELYK